MEIEMYRKAYELEDDYWWFIGLQELLISYIEEWGAQRADMRLLDAGCGTGKLLEMCRRYNAWGLELAVEGIGFACRRAPGAVVQGSVCDVPFADGSFDVVVCADVLYHMGVDNDEKALAEFQRVLAPGGILLLHLCAFEFLRRGHDILGHTRHRYRRPEVRTKLNKVGLEVMRITYRNSFLFLGALMMKCWENLSSRRLKTAESDYIPMPSLLNRALITLLLTENRLIHTGFTFPFGLSVFCVARKPEES